MQSNATLLGRPPRGPPQQLTMVSPQQMPQAGQLLRGQGPNGVRMGGAGVGAPQQLAMPSMLSSGHSLTANNLQSFAALKEQADQMFQTTRAEQKNKEDLLAQLKLKDKEIVQLNETMKKHQQRTMQLAAELDKSEQTAKKIVERIELLTRAHDQLLSGVQEAGAELADGNVTAVELESRYQAQNNQLEDLASKYTVLSAEKSALQTKLEAALLQAAEAKSGYQAAAISEQRLTLLLQRAEAEAEERKRDLERTVEHKDGLEAKMSTLVMKSEDLALQLSQAVTAKEAADARWQAELLRVQSELGSCRSSLEEARAQCTKQAQFVQESDKRTAILEAQHKALSDKIEDLQSQLVAAKDAQAATTKRLADEQAAVRSLQEQLAAAKAASAGATQAMTELEGKCKELGDKVVEVDAQLKAEQEARAGVLFELEALRTATEEHKAIHQSELDQVRQQGAAVQAELEEAKKRLVAMEETHRKELAAAQSAAGQATKHQIDVRVQKAVENNAKQAQKALDEQKKKSAAELKKVQDELKKATDKITSLTKEAAEASKAKEAAQKAAADTTTAVQEAVEKERAAATTAVAAAEKELRAKLADDHSAKLEGAKKKWEQEMQEKTLAAQKELESKLAEARMSAATDLLKERQQADEKLAEMLKQLNNAKDQEKALRDQLQSQAASAGMLNQEQVALQSRVQSLLEEVQASKVAMERVSKERSAKEEELEKLRAELVTLRESAVEGAEAKVQAATAELDKAKAVNKTVAQERDELKTKVTKLAADLAAAEKANEQLRKDSRGATQDAAAAEKVTLAAQTKAKHAPPRFFESSAVDSHMAAVDHAPRPDNKRKIWTDMDSDADSQDIKSTGVGGFFRGTTPVQYSKRSKGVEAAMAMAPPASRPVTAATHANTNSRSLFSGAVLSARVGSQQPSASLRAGSAGGASLQPSQAILNNHMKNKVVVATQSAAVSEDDEPMSKVAKASGRSRPSGRNKSTLLPAQRKADAGRARDTTSARNKISAPQAQGLFSLFS